MGTELRYPNIKGRTEREQIAELKSYLYQLVGQLEFALNNVGSSSDTVITTVTRSGAAEPAPTGSIDPISTFNAIKALIIKSSDIVQAYYNEIVTRLEGIYVAESDFGIFSEQTSQTLTQNSTEIEQLFTNLQTITTDIETLEYSLIEVNAHVRSGLLYYDDGGTPIYGLEIGQKNTVDGEEVFNKYARFTSDRLSFYDQNDNEVAYISDYKLFIRNVEITSVYKIGGLEDKVMSNGDVVTKWVGGGS